MRKLSIIVPVYKVEEFVEKCILSLENQDLNRHDYEIIVVNDGSPDRSREIVASLAERFENIRLIDQANQGVSAARNTGINNATGELVLFVDPDDYLDKNCLGILVRKMDELASCQVLMVGLKEVDVAGKVTYLDKHTPSCHNVTGTNLYYDFRRARGETGVDAAYGLVIRRDFLLRNDLYFLEGVPYLEDGEFIARLFCVADHCVYINTPYYNRMIRPGSATTSRLYYSDLATKGFVRAACNLLTHRNKAALSVRQRSFLNQPIIKFSLLAVQSCATASRLWHVRKVHDLLVANGLRKLDITGSTPFFQRYASLYNQSIYLFFFSWLWRSLLISTRRRLRYAKFAITLTLFI